MCRLLVNLCFRGFMKNLYDTANRQLRSSDWKNIAALKTCALALGIFTGILIPSKYKKAAAVRCFFIFIASYLPLMLKLVTSEDKAEKKRQR